MQPAPTQISDADLVRAIARGEEQALASFYDRYKVILFSLILRILNSRDEAEDVLQDVFFQVWRRASDFDESRGRPFTWLVTMGRSRAIDRLRTLASRQRVATEAANAVPDVVMGDAIQDALNSEQSAIVQQALSQLPEDQRQTLLLAYFEGLTQVEIAERLGTPLGTVKTRMRSGMMKLKASLGEKMRGLL